MDKVTTIGLDLAKTYLQVHGVDEHGRTVVQRRLRRSEVLVFFRKLSPCLVGMEACATAHHWARELLELGHDVGLMPPAYVKAYVQRGKTDGEEDRGRSAAAQADERCRFSSFIRCLPLIFERLAAQPPLPRSGCCDRPRRRLSLCTPEPGFLATLAPF